MLKLFIASDLSHFRNAFYCINLYANLHLTLTLKNLIFALVCVTIQSTSSCYLSLAHSLILLPCDSTQVQHVLQ